MISRNLDCPYVVAEIGANHNGDMDLAHKLIEEAIAAGADCVKFQSWSKDTIFSRIKYEENYFIADDYRNRDDFTLEQIVEEFSVSQKELIELKKTSDSLGVDFVCTPFSNHEADFLAAELDVPFFKIASMDVNNYPFLEHVARIGKPIVFSTGMSTLAEIDRAVATIENTGNTDICILHCVAEYPPEDANTNLNNIVTLQRNYPQFEIGFSDHSIGVCLPLAAAALGAKIIEKHFTLDKEMSGWDHKISACPKEMAMICDGVKRIGLAMGSNRIETPESNERKLEFRRSIVTTRAIKAGEKFAASDLTFKRPGTGVKPEYYQLMIGRTARRDIAEDEVIQFSDF